MAALLGGARVLDGSRRQEGLRPWADRDHPDADPDDDARWKWSPPQNWADKATVDMVQDEPRIDGHVVVLDRERGPYFEDPDPYGLVDGDDVRDPETGEAYSGFIAILEQLGLNYAEVSTSGAGIHAIYRGQLPEGVKKVSFDLDDAPWGTNEDPPSVEIYDGRRLCVTTGEHVPGAPARSASGTRPASRRSWRNTPTRRTSAPRRTTPTDMRHRWRTTSPASAPRVRRPPTYVTSATQWIASSLRMYHWTHATSASTPPGGTSGTPPVTVRVRVARASTVRPAKASSTTTSTVACTASSVFSRPSRGSSIGPGPPRGQRLVGRGRRRPRGRRAHPRVRTDERARPCCSLPLGQLEALAPDERRRFAQKRDLEWPTTDEARERLAETVAEVLRHEDDRIVDARTALGKIHTIATTRWGAREDVDPEEIATSPVRESYTWTVAIRDRKAGADDPPSVDPSADTGETGLGRWMEAPQGTG